MEVNDPQRSEKKDLFFTLFLPVFTEGWEEGEVQPDAAQPPLQNMALTAATSL